MDTGGQGNFQGGPPGGFPSGGRPGGFRGARGLFFMNPTLLLVVLGVTMLVLVITFYQIYKKAGFNGIMGLLMLVPGVNLAAMLFVAFADWPVLKKVREIEQERAVAAAIAPPTAE